MKREPPVDYVKHGAVRLAIRRSVVRVLVRDPNVPQMDGQPPTLIYKDYESFYVDARTAGRGRIRAATVEEAKEKGKPIAKEIAQEGTAAIELSPDERRMYVSAAETLEPFGLTVDEGARELAKILEKLDGESFDKVHEAYSAGRVRSAPRDTHWLISDPVERNKLFSAAGDGFFQSRDDGETWQRFEEGLDATYCWNLAMSSGPSRVLLMSAAKDAYGAHYEQFSNSSVYRRAEDAPWQKMQAGLPDSQDHRAAAIASCEASPGVFFLSTEGSVFRSTNEGIDWRELPINWLHGRAKHAVGIVIG